MSAGSRDMDWLAVNTIRMLAVDMVEAANSGHPGLPLGAAPMTYVLFSRFLKFNPANPDWTDRDRFVLSAGHGSALLYAMLHLAGYDLPLEELKRFRQWDSKTPGHPEYGMTPGVECTTGPLGQGFAMGVGMAMAESFLAASFNRPGHNLVDHHTFGLVSDGDLMEGISSEAASLAGTLGLGKLIYLYDDNGISIEGSTDLAFTEDVSRRFQAYGWQVIRVADGNDLESIHTAIDNAIDDKDRPSLVMVRTHIGYGSPRQDSEKAHGEPLGAENTQATKEFYKWPADAPFHVPEEVTGHFAVLKEKGKAREEEWGAKLTEYGKAFQDEALRYGRQMRGELPLSWQSCLPRFTPADGAMATRAASGKALAALANKLSYMMGGSADLSPSNQTWIDGAPRFGSGQPGARNIHFGVREHAMGAIMNGMALHGGIIPYGGTFLVFSDYMRPAIRLAALMGLSPIYVFTHDSIGVGEDGPTHQPVEHLAALRAIPGLTVMRPADANETAAAWATAVTAKGPTALILTRQKLPTLDPDMADIREGVAKGGYVLASGGDAPRIILMASGSEVPLILEAAKRLEADNISARVVSMPSWECFADQPQDYRDQVLPPAVTARLAVEAGVSMGWERWVGDAGDVIAMNRFGESAPGDVLMEKFGFSVDNVVERAKKLVS